MRVSKIISILFLLFLQGQSYASSNKNIDKLALTFIKQNNIERLSIVSLNKSGEIQIFNRGYVYSATLATAATEKATANSNVLIRQYLPMLDNNTNFESATPWVLLAHVSGILTQHQNEYCLLRNLTCGQLG